MAANKSLETLALRKELLQARSALYRVKILQDIGAVRGSLGWTKLGVKMVTSYSVRSVLLGLGLKFLRRRRAPRLLAIASAAVMFAKLGGSVAKLFRKRT